MRVLRKHLSRIERQTHFIDLICRLDIAKEIVPDYVNRNFQNQTAKTHFVLLRYKKRQTEPMNWI